MGLLDVVNSEFYLVESKLAGIKHANIASSLLFLAAGIWVVLFGDKYKYIVTSKHMALLLSSLARIALVLGECASPAVYFVAGGLVSDAVYMLLFPKALRKLMLVVSTSLTWYLFLGLAIHPSWPFVLPLTAALFACTLFLYIKNKSLAVGLCLAQVSASAMGIGFYGTIHSLLSLDPYSGIAYMRSVPPLIILLPELLLVARMLHGKGKLSLKEP